MTVYCVANLDNKDQIDNLCECIKILGGEPIVRFGDVSVDYKGTKAQCEKFIELFEHYHRHGIYTEDEEA